MEIIAAPSLQARVFQRAIAVLTSVKKVDHTNYLYHRRKLEQLSKLVPKTKHVAHQPDVLDGFTTEWMRPTNAKQDTVLYYLHGGGYAICSINTHRSLIARIARAASVNAFAINYRLAPEHLFPAAVEDAVKGYEHLLEKDFHPKKIIIAGDSAGGGLTIATMLSLKKKGVPLPSSAVCIAPWTDLEGVGNSHVANAKKERLLSTEAIKEWGKIYVGNESIRHPLAAPIYADLTGLPPLFIQVSTTEILLDDSVRLHERALAHRVDSTLEKWNGLMHVWHVHPFLPDSGRAIRNIAAFANKHL